jgi:hypothetical protein
MSLTTGKKIAWHKFTEMPMTEAVMKQIKKWAIKDRTQNGLMFKNRNREEYKFNDNREDTSIAHPENAPFPDIPAEAPGILTKQEETQGVNAIQEEPVQSNEEPWLKTLDWNWERSTFLNNVKSPSYLMMMTRMHSTISFNTMLRSKSRTCKMMTQERL